MQAVILTIGWLWMWTTQTEIVNHAISDANKIARDAAMNNLKLARDALVISARQADGIWFIGAGLVAITLVLVAGVVLEYRRKACLMHEPRAP